MTTHRQRRVSMTVRSLNRGVDHVHRSVKFARRSRVLLAVGLAVAAAAWMLSRCSGFRPAASRPLPARAGCGSGTGGAACSVPGMDMPIADGSCSQVQRPRARTAATYQPSASYRSPIAGHATSTGFTS
jgi:hypothetical protein